MLTGLLAAASAVPGPQQPFVAGASFLSGLMPSNKKDPERIATAASNLTKALAGDAAALAALQSQAVSSATEVGKEAARRALTAYAAQKGQFVSPAAAVSPLQAVINQTSQNVANDVAAGVQQIGAGATNTLTQRISGNNTALTVPLNRTQLLILAAVAAGIILLRRR